MKHKAPHQADYNLKANVNGNSKINETCRAHGIFYHKSTADKNALKYILHLEMIIRNIHSMAFSPQANYIDRATAACRRS
jgi:hypothetical protein